MRFEIVRSHVRPGPRWDTPNHRRAVLATMLLAAAGISSLHQAAGAEIDAAGLYQAYCSVCHGERGDGRSRVRKSLDPPPRSFTEPAAVAELDRARMIQSVTEGRPGTAMAAWKHQLSAEQIASVVDYIREQLMVPAPAADRSLGQTLYAQHCSVCHGDQGNGRSRASRSFYPPPRDFTAPRARQQLTRERMIFSVTNGRPNTAMAPWGSQLSNEQIEAVVDYVRDKFMQPVATLPSPHAQGPQAGEADHRAGQATESHHHMLPTSEQELTAFLGAAFPGGLAGDAAWGRRFYRDNCATCHGEDGEGRGPRAYFILPKPRDFKHPAARRSLNRPHLYEAIALGSKGTVMSAWDKVLSPQEIANVAEYVFQAFVSSQTDSQASSPSHRHGKVEPIGPRP